MDIYRATGGSHPFDSVMAIREDPLELLHGDETGKNDFLITKEGSDPPIS